MCLPDYMKVTAGCACATQTNGSETQGNQTKNIRDQSVQAVMMRRAVLHTR